jgi:hypothetical protein
MYCPNCRASAPPEAIACRVCGYPLLPLSSGSPAAYQTAAGPAVRLGRAGAAPPAQDSRGALRRTTAATLLGLLYALLLPVVLALAFVRAGISLASVGVLLLLVGGAMGAIVELLRGGWAAGLSGMLIWGGLIGLVALGVPLPLSLLLAAGWLLLSRLTSLRQL